MDNKKVFMGNLNFAATEEDLTALLSSYGTVVAVTIHKKKGYAFIEMSEETEAAQAIEKLNGTTFMDREVRISLAMKAKKARAASIKRYDERSEDISRQKKRRNIDNRPRVTTGHGFLKNEYGITHRLEESYNSRDHSNDPDNRQGGGRSRKRPGAPRPQKKEWSHDRPARPGRSSNDARRHGRGGSPEHEGGPQHRSSSSSRPRSGPGGRTNPGRSAGPKPRGGAGRRDRGGRPGND